MGKLGDLLEGEATLATLASALRPWAGRMVVDKTGLSGSYRVRMNFDMMAAVRGPATGAPVPDAAPTIFTAVQEQLGLKLEPSRAWRDVLSSTTSSGRRRTDARSMTNAALNAIVSASADHHGTLPGQGGP